MTDLSNFLVTHKWPARHPEPLQLNSLPTPNGVKVSIMLEEIDLSCYLFNSALRRWDEG